METLELALEPREQIGKKVSRLRREGLIPVVIYGQGKTAVNCQVAYTVFEKLYNKAGASTIVEVSVGKDKKIPTLIHTVDREPVMDRILHVDFLAVNMDKEVKAIVQLKAVGVAPAIKEFSGVVVTPRDSVHIRCLPKDLVHEIEMDLSTLEKIGDSIHVKDLKVGAGITIEEEPSVVLVMISAPRAEETTKTAEVAAVPVEGAAPAEGAAAPATEGTAAPAEKDKKEKKE